jgi:hypothetical protein
MKILAPLLVLLAAGCVNTMDRAPQTWYPEVEVVCHVRGCARCGGSSLVGCHPCHASGQVRCTACRDGKEKCGVCGGDGQKGGHKCKTCNGDGIKKCSRCGGDMKMACGGCEGKGRICCLRRVEIRDPIPRGDDAWPAGNEPGP